ncbi:hypothetical protein HOE04_00385 [archaeon]|jgi:hypothetical protein|nr:hypothetical protein [archaeon]
MKTQREYKHPVHKEIYEEIKSCIKIYENKWREEFFNNFRMLMPTRGEFGWHFDELDEPYLFPGWKESGQHSELLGNQTTRQFRDTIQKIIQEIGTTQDELTDAIWQEKGQKHAFKVFFPVYLKLRELGYCRQELQG